MAAQRVRVSDHDPNSSSGVARCGVESPSIVGSRNVVELVRIDQLLASATRIRARGSSPTTDPQFVAPDFKEFIRVAGMSHVRTSPYYPQSNGIIERWHKDPQEHRFTPCPTRRSRPSPNPRLSLRRPLQFVSVFTARSATSPPTTSSTDAQKPSGPSGIESSIKPARTAPSGELPSGQRQLEARYDDCVTLSTRRPFHGEPVQSFRGRIIPPDVMHFVHDPHHLISMIRGITRCCVDK